MPTVIIEQEKVESPVSMKSLARASLLDGRYRLYEQVGRGGFSRVYRAEDTCDNDHVVAIKQLCMNGMNPVIRTIAKDTFQREATILARLEHPQIPRLHKQVITPGGGKYLVLDFVAGETLEYLLAHRTEPFGCRDVLAIGQQICSILSYLHQLQPPILFLDLKPSNVMRTADGQIYLVDFGTARPFIEGLYDPFSLGTEGYCAPEQRPDPQGRAYPRPGSDIYSFGVLLHELLSGLEPDPHGRISFSRLSRRSLPSGCETLIPLIAAMLERTPQNRPNIAQIAQALHKLYERYGKPLA